jgi:hypothetical protein
MKKDDLVARRRFFAGAGAALVAPAAVASLGTGDALADDRAASLAERLAALEDAHAIREIERAYLRHVNAGTLAAAAAELFAHRECAGAGVALREIAAEAESDIVVGADRRTAALCLRCKVGVDVAIEAPGCTLVDMARAQGEGVVRRTESRRLELALVRSAAGWKIECVRLLGA